MVMFNKYSVYSAPNKLELEFYSQDWETAQNEEKLIAFLNEHKPRSLMFEEQTIHYFLIREPDRIFATPKEIKDLTEGNNIINNPFIVADAPMQRYGFYGEQEVIEPLLVKLGEEHGAYIESMTELYNQDKNAFMERLGEIAAYDLCFNNLVGCANYYTQDYLRELLKEENSLKTLSEAYLSEIGFPIEERLLNDFKAATTYGVTSKMLPANPDTYEGQPAEDRISAFHKSLDSLYKYCVEKWNGYTADEAVHNALQMFTYGQLYNELKNNLGNYPAEDVYNFAEVGNVFELLDVRHVGERMLDQYSTANFPKVLQSLYPHIEPEEDIWHTPKEESEEMSDEDQAPQMTM